MQARGPYDESSPAYNHIVSVVTDYVSYFRKTHSSEMGWLKSEAASMKTMLAIAFGCGEFCGTTCGQVHIDIFKGDECNLSGSGMKLR